MKLPAATTWATHLLALLAGVGIVQMIRTHGIAGTTSGSVKAVGRSAARDAGTTEVLRRLEASREEERQRLRSAHEVPDDPALPLPETPTRVQSLLSWRAERVEAERKKLDGLIKRSEDFRKVEDLRVPLMEAFMESEETETSEAIFIEWYRRDPLAAMNELAARPKWSAKVLDEEALILHLTPEVLLAQLGARDRSDDFRKGITRGLAGYWLERDDLRGLATAYDTLGSFQAERLMSEFIEREWIPRDGAAALAFVSDGMSERCRKTFLTKLSRVRPGEGSCEWSEGMAAPLFRQVLGEEQVSTNRQEAEAAASHTPIGGCCGGGEDEFIDLPDHERVAKWMSDITPENESEALSGALSRLLGHDRDYHELFEFGKVTAEEIFQDLLPQIPNGKDYESGLRRELYADLAAWNPKAAVEWASGHLTEAELQSVSLTSYDVTNDPRALRCLDLMEMLPLKFEGNRYVGEMPQSFSRRLEDWKVLDPEVAAAAMGRSPKAMELAEKLQEEPSSFDPDPPERTVPDSIEDTGDTEQ